MSGCKRIRAEDGAAVCGGSCAGSDAAEADIAWSYRGGRSGSSSEEVGVGGDMLAALLFEFGVEPICAELDGIARARASDIAIEVVEERSEVGGARHVGRWCLWGGGGLVEWQWI